MLEPMIYVALGALAVLGLLTILTLALTVKLYIDLKALQNSTHKVTYIDPMANAKIDTESFESFSDELVKEITKPKFDNIQ